MSKRGNNRTIRDIRLRIRKIWLATSSDKSRQNNHYSVIYFCRSTIKPSSGWRQGTAVAFTVRSGPQAGATARGRKNGGETSCHQHSGLEKKAGLP